MTFASVNVGVLLRGIFVQACCVVLVEAYTVPSESVL